MLCTAASRLRRAVSLIAPRRPRSSALRALPGASDYYVPVLGTECIEWLARDEGVFVDCTLGGGDHSSLLLERVGAKAKVFDDASESDEDEDEPVAAPRVHARDEPAEGLNEENGGRPRRRARTGG